MSLRFSLALACAFASIVTMMAYSTAAQSSSAQNSAPAPTQAPSDVEMDAKARRLAVLCQKGLDAERAKPGGFMNVVRQWVRETKPSQKEQEIQAQFCVKYNAAYVAAQSTGSSSPIPPKSASAQMPVVMPTANETQMAAQRDAETAETKRLNAACQIYVGQQAAPQTFDAVAAIVAKVPAFKDEYETTDAFNARQVAATKGWPSTFLIGYSSTSDQKSHLKFDADQSALNVTADFFYDKRRDYYHFFVFGRSTPYYGKVGYSEGLDNIDIVVSETERNIGTYRGSNAFGASATITKISRVTKAIWERSDGFETKIFVDEGEGNPSVIRSVPMTADQAKALKAGASAALVIAPRWPYFAKGTSSQSPTLRNPIDLNNDISVIVADIQCALLLDPTKKVVAAFAVK